MNTPLTWRLYNGAAVGYDEYRPKYPEDVFGILSRYHVAPVPLRTAVDVGAGTGIFSRQLMELVPSIESLTCVDANSDMAAIAKERSTTFRGLDVLIGLAENLPLPDRSCDLVTAATSANWFDRPKFYDQAARVLKPSGTLLLLQNNHRYWESAFLDDFYSFQERHIPGYCRGRYSNCLGGYGKADFEAELRSRSDLVAVERHKIEWQQMITADQFRGYCYSMAHIKTAIDHSGAASIAHDIDALLERHRDGSGNVAVEWLTDVVFSRAAP
ncbi:class I SAM-dependent methyltransferase [Bradyrhizobium brasilense]|uniref:class I SAM-dependent methyltransferase n=1 Tax=Bradyrhizobium brasilense TaxID=1419277 RepID=UPI0028781160|nr:class I SAM-dependent methyltransferase [Bradyrhizobium brasilense]MCP3417863.1 class I SAM-dependent methyltransferase [Bradyrhizobium brasilense]